MNEIKVVTIKDNEKFLRKISSLVDLENDDYLKDVEIIKEYCAHHAVFALACIQIGIDKRIICLKNTTEQAELNDTDYNENKVLINPRILKSKGHTKYLEACASCLNLSGVVIRPYEIEVEYYDLDKNKHIEIFNGMASTVLSHEIDHLDGILHIDRTNEIYEMDKEQRKVYRQTHPYEIIDKEKEFIYGNINR